jgi:hypothetical protein
MNNPVTNFMDKAKGLTRNPLGIIALFISLIYGFACLVLSTSIKNLQYPCERLPLIWFIILFPILILGAFTYLVVKHHPKLYGPSDFKDEKNFINTFVGSPVSADLEKVNTQLKSLTTEKHTEQLAASINKIAEEINRIKEKSEKIPINNLWRLNHWGSKCASIVGDKMVFMGTSTPKEADGSHIDLNNLLEVGKSYEVSCFVKSDPNTTAMFQLWCHDNTGAKPDGSNASTPYQTPSTAGEKIKLQFNADFNTSLRIHLQYKPGVGRIEVTDVRVSEIRTS